MKSKKTLLSLLAVAMITVSIGCANDEAKSGAETPATETKAPETETRDAGIVTPSPTDSTAMKSGPIDTGDRNEVVVNPIKPAPTNAVKE